MGYMGLRSFGEVDDAADTMFRVLDHLTAELKRGLRERGNSVNPCGAVNNGLINEALILPSAKRISLSGGTEGLIEVLKQTEVKLVEEIKDGVETSPYDWGDRNNKRSHLRAYNRILKNLRTSIRILEKYPDQWLMAAHRRRVAKKKK